MFELIDTHCHLDFERFDEDRDAVVARAFENGVTRIIVPALQLENCQSVLDLADKYEGVFAAVGVHPNSSAEWRPEHVDVIRHFAQHPKVVAIGEIGLDYHWDKSPKATQQAAFAAQMALAAELALPVIIHNRKSSADVVALMAASDLVGRVNAGVMHSFSASAEIAQKVLDLGFYLGFTGPVTFKKADELRAIVGEVPLERMLVETDAPFLSPVPRRGRRNEPGHVRYIAERIAVVRNTSLETIAAQTTANAERLFGLRDIF